MPVSAWIGLGMPPPGLTRVCHCAVTWKPCTSSTAISVTRSDAGSVPVVSRSTMASGASSRRISLRLDVGRLDYLGPFRRVGADALDELLGRAADRLGTDRVEALAQVGGLNAGDHLTLQPRDDLTRRARRREHAEPGVEVELRHAGLGEGRDLGQQRRALGRVQ